MEAHVYIFLLLFNFDGLVQERLNSSVHWSYIFLALTSGSDIHFNCYCVCLITILWIYASKIWAWWFIFLLSKLIWKCLLQNVGLSVIEVGEFPPALCICMLSTGSGCIHVSHSSLLCGMISLENHWLISALQLGDCLSLTHWGSDKMHFHQWKCMNFIKLCS